VTRYAFFAWNHPSPWQRFWRYGKVVLGVPLWICLDLYSRRRFNEVFYRQYRGMEQDWLRRQGQHLLDAEIRRKIYPGARDLLAADRAAGLRLVLVSGGMDFAIEPAAKALGFDDLIANRLVFRDGKATGEVAPPLLAEQQKVKAILDYCEKYNVDRGESKAYSDSLSDVPMLEAVGLPAAVHPDRRLKRVAAQRGWPVLDLKTTRHGDFHQAANARL
jgi:HAD superfamily hydrolase (TIGR01490 family)